MKKHLNIHITGQVQGVYFRASTKEKAESLNIHGFVRNEPDGSVYVESEGEEKSLEEFVRWCRRGPARAEVKRCDVTGGELRNFKGFTIKRG